MSRPAPPPNEIASELPRGADEQDLSSEASELPVLMPPRSARLRGVVGLLVLAALIYFLAGPMQNADMDAVRAEVEAMGALGILIYLVAFTILQPVGVSSHFFCFSAAMIWGFPEAFFLTWLGGTFATIGTFTFARYMARDFIEARIPARFRGIQKKLAASSFRTVLILRALFWCAPPIGLALGVSRFPAWKHHLASFLGPLPSVAFSCLLAAGLREAIETGDYTSGVFIGAVVTFAVFAVIILYYGLSMLQRLRAPNQEPREFDVT